MIRNAGEVIQRQLQRLRASVAPQGAFGLARLPESLVFAPQDIRTAEPSIGADIYAGQLVFAGRAAFTHGQSLFDVRPPAPGWAAELYGFAWLRHLRGSDNAAVRAYARSVIADWAKRGGAASAPEARWPRAAARRLISLLAHSPLLLEGADQESYRAFMRLAAADARLIEGNAARLQGFSKLASLIALAYYTLCSAQSEAAADKVVAALAFELDSQIGSDGMHASRSPAALLELVIDLLPLQEICIRQRQAPPAALSGALQRMLGAIRCLRHSSGDLALFNGMGITRFGGLTAALAHGERSAGSETPESCGGYERIEAGGGAVVIMDAAAPPSGPDSGAAHAGTLGFEMSAGGHRLIVNCGAPFAGYPALAGPARATAAHSALVIADTSSSRFDEETDASGQQKFRLRHAPQSVTAQRQSNDGAIRVTASHDGYAKPFGIVHERALTCERRTGNLSGCDRLISAKGARPQPFAIRFHLHPSVSAEAEPGSGIVRLRGPSGEFLFAAERGPAAIEESVFFATPLGQQKTRQIVIAADTGEAAETRWSLTRADR